MSTSRSLVVLATVSASAVLGACTTAITGHPVAEQPEAGASAPATPGTGLAGEPDGAALRAIDPCALHSVAAAAEVTGMEPDEIMPGQSLASCVIELVPGPLELATWTISATVGAPFEEQDRTEATAETIGKVEVFKPSGYDAEAGADLCAYIVPVSPTAGLELYVTRTDDKVKQAACEVAEAYLTKVISYWASPALRSDEVTTPQFRVATLDPCTGLTELAADLGGEVRTFASNPFTCSAMAMAPAKAIGSGVTTVEIGVEKDPLKVLDSKVALGTDTGYVTDAVTIAGKPGVRSSTTGEAQISSCSVTVVVDEQVVLRSNQADPEALPSYQVVSARGGTCAIAEKAAELVVSSMS